MIKDARLRKVSFTGSTEVGRGLVKDAADQLLRTSMELGGNAPFLVFEDADLDKAVDGAMLAKMRNMGEACTAANRFHVHASVAEEFSRRLAERMGALKVGRGTGDGVQVGPLIDEAGRAKVEELVADAVDRGAKPVTGGGRLDGPGYFYSPTVLSGVEPGSRILAEEVFGPVAPITTFETDDEAIAAANDTEFGLVSYAFTGVVEPRTEGDRGARGRHDRAQPRPGLQPGRAVRRHQAVGLRARGWAGGDLGVPRREVRQHAALMDFRDTAEEAAFRAELRAWFAANLPAGWADRDPTVGLEDVDFLRAWSRKLFDAGYAGITWPKEYGGLGLPPTFQGIYLEEMARHDAPAHIGVIGLGMAGPTILAWGSDEQKARYLSPLLAGEEVWCQGFSEPGAGSDLAAARTRAELDGDEWVVNGQKVWSSYAHIADWCILVVRTDPEAERHRGLSYLLVDMHAPGVEVRPLRQITGDPEFNEIYFTDVRVPRGLDARQARRGLAGRDDHAAARARHPGLRAHGALRGPARAARRGRARRAAGRDASGRRPARA